MLSPCQIPPCRNLISFRPSIFPPTSCSDRGLVSPFSTLPFKVGEFTRLRPFRSLGHPFSSFPWSGDPICSHRLLCNFEISASNPIFPFFPFLLITFLQLISCFPPTSTACGIHDGFSFLWRVQPGLVSCNFLYPHLSAPPLQEATMFLNRLHFQTIFSRVRRMPVPPSGLMLSCSLVCLTVCPRLLLFFFLWDLL